ncbi:hypothetical protein H2200_004878 [Cladophialophora chaetospira]|uniref:Uncharacterized protein n=1 Tax=Cladophialophora chaetospira TaxID=386627 RepID=A0AA38XE53_9EURO|nr:hypothetical protein H2200_004878 [Cladophialophora chaetospira]
MIFIKSRILFEGNYDRCIKLRWSYFEAFSEFNTLDKEQECLEKAPAMRYREYGKDIEAFEYDRARGQGLLNLLSTLGERELIEPASTGISATTKKGQFPDQMLHLPLFAKFKFDNSPIGCMADWLSVSIEFSPGIGDSHGRFVVEGDDAC